MSDKKKPNNRKRAAPIRYAAFLRGINVSKQKLIKMADLTRMFEGMGFKNVKTYIQSGNVIFDSAERDRAKLVKTIELGLAKVLGYKVDVLVESVGDLRAIVALDPFKKVKAKPDAKWYVTFIAQELDTAPNLPLVSSKKDVEVFRIEGRVVFSLANLTEEGRSGFPNLFIEKQFKLPATTRNWTTVTKVIELAAAP